MRSDKSNNDSPITAAPTAPSTVYIGWMELVRWLGEWGFTKWECEQLRAAGVIEAREFGAGVRRKYCWREVQTALELGDERPGTAGDGR